MSFKTGKFGLLTIRKQVAPDIFDCDCKCGGTGEFWRSQLVSKVAIDCGCRARARKPKRNPRYWTPERVEQLAKMRADGKSWREIGKAFGKNHHTVGHVHRLMVVRKVPWPNQEPYRHWVRTRPFGCYHGHLRNFVRTDGTKGRYTTAEFNTWSSVVQRCMSKKHHAFENYGGRGIRLCKRWQGTVGFGNFLEDMGPRPAGMTLDRKNPQGHYEPTNCRWATRDVQANNQARYLWPDGALPVEKVREMEQRIREDAEFASDYAYSF